MVTALEGLRILDLTRYAPGPYGTMLLADLGADVIKVEEIGSPTGRRAEQMKGAVAQTTPSEFATPDSPFNPLNRNKRSIRLNLKDDRGRQIFQRLASKADVVIEQFRPGVTKRLGIDYDTLKEMNPRLIYCAITGYGQDGPYRDLAGHDINYIATAGVTDTISLPGDKPTVPGNLVGDMAAGGMQAAIGVLAALAAREKTGRGQFVDISMTDGALSMLSLYLGRYLEKGTQLAPAERASCGGAPYYNYYETGDGKYIAIGCTEPWFFANLCRALDCERFIPDQLDTDKAAEMAAYFKKQFLSKTSKEWLDILSKTDIPVSPVNKLDELAEDPQFIHRQMIVDTEGTGKNKVRQAGIAIKLSETPGSIRTRGGLPGENTEEILVELGYSKEEISELQMERVVDTKD